MSLGIVVEVGIGLMLMYLVLSLMVTTINELIAQFGSIRARHLQSALRKMLNLHLGADDQENLKLFDAIKASPTFQIAGAISKTQWSGVDARPSYIKRDTFIAALREAIPKIADAKAGVTSGSDLAGLINALPDKSPIKSALSAAIADVKATAQDVEQRIGNWYDAMMERATGAYKRWMSAFSLVIGLLLAVAFNCDTIHVANQLAKSPEMRAKVALAAEEVTKRCTGTDGKPALDGASCAAMQKNLDALQALPIGRAAGPYAIFGWLLTAFAVSLGAPFWFDLLSKIMNVRSSFRKSEPPPAAQM